MNLEVDFKEFINYASLYSINNEGSGRTYYSMLEKVASKNVDKIFNIFEKEEELEEFKKENMISSIDEIIYGLENQSYIGKKVLNSIVKVSLKFYFKFEFIYFILFYFIF
jgi:hypothetical protein